MRRVSIDHVVPGSRLSKPIYSSDNCSILLCAGTELTDNYIEKLKRLGFASLYVDDGFIDDIEVEEVVPQETRERAVFLIKKATEEARKCTSINVSSLKTVVSDFVHEMIANRQMMLSLNQIFAYDDYTFNHSVNVTIVSLMIGICSHYDSGRLMDLGMGVLLHDIGKVKIPADIINKPGKLSVEELEIVKKHTVDGFEMLRTNSEIRLTSAHVALQHHERYNGSGYPRQLKGDNIIEFARIAAIADVYDALSNDRCYRNKFEPERVYDFLAERRGIDFDPLILDRFLDKIAVFPIGTMVVLNDGRAGFVIRQNQMAPKTPVVRLFWECDGTEMLKPFELDLLHQPDLGVFRIIEGDIKEHLSLLKRTSTSF